MKQSAAQPTATVVVSLVSTPQAPWPAIADASSIQRRPGEDIGPPRTLPANPSPQIPLTLAHIRRPGRDRARGRRHRHRSRGHRPPFVAPRRPGAPPSSSPSPSPIGWSSDGLLPRHRALFSATAAASRRRARRVRPSPHLQTTSTSFAVSSSVDSPRFPLRSVPFYAVVLSVPSSDGALLPCTNCCSCLLLLLLCCAPFCCCHCILLLATAAQADALLLLLVVAAA
jgi:hypothetical protein